MNTNTETRPQTQPNTSSNGHSSQSLVRPNNQPAPRHPFGSGMLAALYLRWTALWTERATEAQLRILGCETRMEAKQSTLDEQKLDSRHRLAKSAFRAEADEAELHLHRTLRSANLDEARSVLEREIEVGTMLQSRAAVRFPRQSLLLSVQAPLPALPPAEPTGMLEVHMSDEQIEGLALQAIARLGQMDRESAEQAWTDWRQELRRKLPTYAADEVIRRSDELRRMVR